MVGYSPWGHKEMDTTEWLLFLYVETQNGLSTILTYKIGNWWDFYINPLSDFEVWSETETVWQKKQLL